MRRNITEKVANTAMLIIAMIMVLMVCGCGSGTIDSSQIESSTSVDRWDEAFEIKDDILNQFPKDINDYVSTVSCVIGDDNEMTVIVRVAMIPDAIPMVADKMCPIIEEEVKRHELSGYSATFQFYTMGNDGKMANSVSWITHDGESGTFMSDKEVYQATLDQVYEHYHDFGKNGGV